MLFRLLFGKHFFSYGKQNKHVINVWWTVKKKRSSDFQSEKWIFVIQMNVAFRVLWLVIILIFCFFHSFSSELSWFPFFVVFFEWSSNLLFILFNDLLLKWSLTTIKSCCLTREKFSVSKSWKRVNSMGDFERNF